MRPVDREEREAGAVGVERGARRDEVGMYVCRFLSVFLCRSFFEKNRLDLQGAACWGGRLQDRYEGKDLRSDPTPTED